MLPSLSRFSHQLQGKLHPVGVRLKGARAFTWHDAAGQSAFDKVRLPRRQDYRGRFRWTPIER